MKQPLLGLSNGKGIDPYNFRPHLDFDPKVVAQSLAHICRYNGHYGWISVAEHCAIVANIMGIQYDVYARRLGVEHLSLHTLNKWKLVGLLHDSMESVIGDITMPVKNHPKLQFLRDLEFEYLAQTYTMHNITLTHEMAEALSLADRYASSVELNYLGQYNNPLWRDYLDMYPPEKYDSVMALGIKPENARDLWLAAYYRLTGGFR